MIVTPTRRVDFAFLQPPPHFELIEEVKSKMSKAPEEFLHSYCRTLIHDSQILGVGGVTPSHQPHIGERWLLLDAKAFHHPILIARHFAEMIQHGQEAIDAQVLNVTLRKQADVLPKMQRLLKAHSFEYVGVLPTYFAGEDYEHWQIRFGRTHVGH